MERLNRLLKKCKSGHTAMEYLNSLLKKCKPEYEKNQILKVQNSLLKFEKDFWE